MFSNNSYTLDTFNTMKYVCCSHGDHVQGAECEALARKDDVGDVFSQYRGGCRGACTPSLAK